MRKKHGYAGIVLTICVIMTGMALISGCGSDEDSTPPPPPQQGAQTQPVGGAPPTNPSPAPGPAATNPNGMPAGPAGPTAPTATAPTAPTQPAAPGQPQTGATATTAVAFSQVGLLSPVKTVSYKQGGSVTQFLRFKYADFQGKVHTCELPISASKATMPLIAWKSTFDLYRQDEQPKGAPHKPSGPKDNLNDYPWGQ